MHQVCQESGHTIMCGGIDVASFYNFGV